MVTEIKKKQNKKNLNEWENTETGEGDKEKDN